MAENAKKYFWLKLKDDFFDEKYIKALRRLPQGDSLVIVYLKMQLKSLKTEGIIKYEQILPDAISELAMVLDEDEHVVRLAVEAMIKFGIVERWENQTFYMVAMQQLIGSETASAARVRKHRELKNKQENKALPPASGTGALHCNTPVTKCNTEIDIEKDIEIDTDTEKEIEIEKKKKSKTSSRFTPPTLDEVIDYCNERLNGVDAERFIDYYTSNGWKVGKNPMKDWKAAVRTWERSETPKTRQGQAAGQGYAQESAIDKARRIAAFYEAQEAQEDDET